MYDLLPITGCCRQRVHCDCVVQTIGVGSQQAIYQGSGSPPLGFLPQVPSKPAIWQDVLNDIDYRWLVATQEWK